MSKAGCNEVWDRGSIATNLGIWSFFEGSFVVIVFSFKWDYFCGVFMHQLKHTWALKDLVQ